MILTYLEFSKLNDALATTIIVMTLISHISICIINSHVFQSVSNHYLMGFFSKGLVNDEGKAIY